MEKVSVIMPNYNHAPYLKERLESILAQDYSEMEVILLDDASTDESMHVLRAYEHHPRVKVLMENTQNSGNTFLQWQKGLSVATGAYVWIAESDDVAEPGMLRCLVEAMEREKAVVAFGRSEWMDSRGTPIARTQDSRWDRNFSMDGEAFVKRFLLGYTTICNASAVVFRREAALNVDMKEVAEFRASGDRLFWIRMALQGRVAYVAKTVNHFRQHTQKVSGNAENQGLNIVQDHAIYRLVAPLLRLTQHEKRLVCGYHWQAMHRPTVSKEGLRRAKEAWGQEPEFGRMAYLIYMMHRLREKC